MQVLACAPHFPPAALGIRNQSKGQRHWAELPPPLHTHSALSPGNTSLPGATDAPPWATALPVVPVSWTSGFQDPEKGDGEARWKLRQEGLLHGNQAAPAPSAGKTQILPDKPANVYTTQPAQS